LAHHIAGVMEQLSGGQCPPYGLTLDLMLISSRMIDPKLINSKPIKPKLRSLC